MKNLKLKLLGPGMFLPLINSWETIVGEEKSNFGKKNVKKKAA